VLKRASISPISVSDDKSAILNVAYNKSEYRYLYRELLCRTLYVINVSAFTLVHFSTASLFSVYHPHVGTAAFIHKCYFIGS
jgi:hypothetical protein